MITIFLCKQVEAAQREKLTIIICKQGEAAQMAARLAESQASLGELDDDLVIDQIQ